MKKLLLVTLVMFTFYSAVAQEKIYNKIFDKNIKTVLMYVEGDDMSFPILDFESSKKLVLTFDDLSEDTRDYYYKLVHCNSDWIPSDLDVSEYIDGYFEDQISEYQSSFNTTINYIHYSLKLPGEYMNPIISGNYVVQVYDSSNPNKILFNKRFMIVDRQTNIEAVIRKMNQSAYFYNDQELEIVVDYYGNEFYDLSQNIKVQVLKNNNWVDYLELNKPDLIKDNEFTFNDFSVLKFKGGNEFHHFNIKNIHYVAENVKNISFVDNMYHFLLTENKDRTFEEYQFGADINGLFKIDVTQSDFPETEADYAYVYFTLNMEVPVQQGEIYIWGALTNYDFTDYNKLQYNFEQKAYEGRLQLKQGYYNYQYVLMENGKLDFNYIDGNHAQTENSYTILVYYHDYSGNYDRLIGVKEVNSK